MRFSGIKNYQTVACVAIAMSLLSACVDDIDDPVISKVIDPTTRPDLVSEVLDKVTISDADAQEIKAQNLPSSSSSSAAPVVSLSQSQRDIEAGSRVSVPFTVDSDFLISALFAKVVGSPDLFTVNFSSTKVETVFSFAFDLPESVGRGTFCVDFAATDINGLSGQTAEPFCFNVVDDASANPTPAATSAPTSTPAPTVAPTQTPTATPTPIPAPSADPATTPEPSQSPTAPPTSEPSPSPTAMPSPSPSETPGGTPTPAPTQEPGPGPASACFNEALFAEGTQYTLTYNTSTTANEGQVDFTDNRTVGAVTMFDGRSAHPAEGTTTSTVSGAGQADGTSVSDTTVYDQFDASVPEVNAIGLVSTTESNNSGFTTTTTVTSTITPGNLRRFDLSPGESYTNNYTTVTETTVGSPLLPGQTTESTTDVMSTVTYLGRNEVSVPAGTFAVCQFQEELTSQTDDGATSSSTNTVNLAVGSGILVLQTSESDSGDTSTTQLTGGSLNGNDL